MVAVVLPHTVALMNVSLKIKFETLMAKQVFGGAHQFFFFLIQQKPRYELERLGAVICK